MHFETGKFGAVVIVVSLILTVVLGYCTDVTKVEVDRTDYDFITDITGLFETEQVPDYIEYNPNSNYVGYTGNVIYETSSQPNNYRIILADGTTTTQTITVTRDSSYTSNNNFLPSDVGTTVDINYTGSAYNMGSTVSFNGLSYNVAVSVNKVTTLNYILNTIPNLTSYVDVSIDLTYGALPVFVIGKGFNFYNVERGDGQSQYLYHTTISDSDIPTRLTYSTVTGLVTAYRGDTMIWQKNSNQVDVIYHYSTRASGSFAVANSSMTMGVSLTTAPTYGYADPQGGVRMTGGQTATWDNGYVNEKISILVGKYNLPQQSAMYFKFYTSAGSSFNFNLWVSISSNGVDINIYDHRVNGVASVTLGKWTGVLLTYDRISGIITATPTGTITDYMTVPTLLGTTVQLTTGWSTNEAIPTNTGFTAITGANVPSPKFGVVDTTVDLNTYKVVMNDPSIDVEDYWPDLDQYRLNFYSFALVGESITINGITYPVSSAQTITVTDADGESYTNTLTNIYITNESVDGQEHTFLTFVNDDLTVDLGTTVNEVISFDGLWFFTTGLYEVIQTTGTEYEWNVDGTFDATAQQVLVVFLGLLASGVLVGKVALKQEIGFLDWLLIIGAGVVALAMSGVFF